MRLPLSLFALSLALFSSAHAAPKLDAADRRVAEKLESVLRERVKSAPGGNVKFKIVPTDRASEGYFSEISISGQNAKVKKLYITSANLLAKNVQIDVAELFGNKKIRTKKSTTTLRAVVSETDLTKMLAGGKHTRDMKLKVKYVGQQLSVTGNLNYTLINGPVQGTGKLRRGADEKIYLDILSLKLRGAEIPAFVKNQFSSHINPVIDIEDLPFNPQFKSVKVVGDKAILST